MKNILSMTNAKCNCTTGAEFTEPKNLIVTMDGPDGSIDIERIKMIVYGLLLPLRASMENGDCIIKKIF